MKKTMCSTKRYITFVGCNYSIGVIFSAEHFMFQSTFLKNTQMLI